MKSGRTYSCPKMLYVQEQFIINMLLITQKQYDRSKMSYLLLRAIVDTENQMGIISSKLSEQDR